MAVHARQVFAVVLACIAALVTAMLLQSGAATAREEAVSVVCPVPTSQVEHGVEVCVARGPNAVYMEGEALTACVSANIPQILIFPPPPPPTIRLSHSVEGVEQGILLEDKFASGERCVRRTVGPPFGQETIRAEAIGADGQVFAMDEVTFRSVPAGDRPSSPCGENPGPPNPTDPAIRVEEPGPAARVTSPLTVSGRARVFEAAVSLRLVDPGGRTIAEGFTMAESGAPALAPFRGTLTFAVDEETAACLWVFEESARDGSPVNVVQVPVVLLPSARYIEAALDLSSPCIPDPGQTACDPNRRALWNGEAAAWAARGVTDADARFIETIILRVRAGDPAVIRNIARALGWPYLKITRVHFAVGREVVEITNLGGAAQDLTGWTVRSPATGAVVRLPAEMLAPGASCYMLTGRPGATAGYECRVFAGIPEAPPIAPPDGFWPDDAGTVVLFADPLGLLADETSYRADPNNQPPPPNLQGTMQVVTDPQPPTPLRFTLSVGQPEYARGSAVEFQMVLRNTNDERPFPLEFPSGQSFDVIVSDAAGNIVWRWSDDRVFTQAQRFETLAPGDERTFSAIWNQHTTAGQQAPPGRYQAIAILTTRDPVRSAPVAFTIQ